MNRSISRRVLAVLAALTLFFALVPARFALADGEAYVHDYYRYTVEDSSITITGYVGKVEEVTIPSIIAGNPVNTIASGAFANNKSVKTINLPDTVTTVEQGAFAPGQQVNYPKGGETPSDGDSPDDGGESPAPVTPSEPASDGPAIHDDEGGLVVVDDDGNLVYVDPEGNEWVIDDTRTYTMTSDANGVSIRSDSGEVKVDGDGTVTLTMADGSTRTRTPDGEIKTVSADGNFTVLTNDRDKDAESEADQPATSSQLAQEHGPVAFALVAVGLFLVAGIALAVRYALRRGNAKM